MMPDRLAAPALVITTLVSMAAGFVLASPELLAAWRMAVILLGGVAIGALMLLAIGRLLENEWHEAISDELLPMSATLPVVVVIAAPLLLLAPDGPAAFFGAGLTEMRATWFATDARQARLGIALLGLLGSTLLIARRRNDPRASALALALTTIASLLVSTDWILLSHPLWWSKLLPFCVAVGNLLAALSVAFILNLAQRETLGQPHHRSLASGLLALALLATWVWYAQYLTAWSGNLPAEARWYLSRMAASGWALKLALVCQAAGTAVLLLLRRRKRAMLGAAVLLLAAYVTHGIWLLRPQETRASAMADGVVLAGLALLWAGWLSFFARLHDRRVAANERLARGNPDRQASDGGQ